jgi:hypothetical protein
VVAEALDLAWLTSYDVSLGKLSDALKELEHGSALLLELKESLQALEKEAPEKLDAVAERVLKGGRLDKLKPAFEKLEAEMKKADEARRKLVYEAKRRFEKARAFREREPFAKATAAIERARTEWMRQEQDRWKRVYALTAVKECFAGPDSDRYRQVLSGLGAKDLVGLEAQVAEILKGCVRKVEREGTLAERDIETLSARLRDARRLSSERKVELPRWVTELERVLPRLKGAGARVVRVSSKVDEYVDEMEEFVGFARRNFDTSLRAIESATSLERLLSHREKIEDWAEKHREKLDGIRESRRPIEADLKELEKLPRSGGGPAEALLVAVRRRVSDWRKRLDAAEADLDDPKVRSMLRGVD